MTTLQPHSSGVKIQDPMLDHQDRYMMKAQVHVSKSSAIFDVQALPRRKYFLLSSGYQFSIPNEDLSDDTTPSVARKFLNEVKSTIVTLQRVVKQRMTIETYNWAFSAHQELHKIEAAKFVGEFKSLANEADASLAKHKALELETERLLKAVTTLRPEDQSLGAIQSMIGVSSASKSSRSKNKEAEVEEHHINLLFSKNNKHISSACNNIKIDSQDVISKVV
nr:hypothetical protein [Tanacetum cinerariifolium]